MCDTVFSESTALRAALSAVGSVLVAALGLLLRSRYVQRSWEPYPLHNAVRLALRLQLGHADSAVGFFIDVDALHAAMHAELPPELCRKPASCGEAIAAAVLAQWGDALPLPAWRPLFGLAPDPCFWRRRLAYRRGVLAGPRGVAVTARDAQQRAESHSGVRTAARSPSRSGRRLSAKGGSAGTSTDGWGSDERPLAGARGGAGEDGSPSGELCGVELSVPRAM